jgi:hypothetical protein
VDVVKSSEYELRHRILVVCGCIAPSEQLAAVDLQLPLIVFVQHVLGSPNLTLTQAVLVACLLAEHLA